MKSNKEMGNDLFALNVEINRGLQCMFSRSPLDYMQDTLGAYLNLVESELEPTPEGEDPETIVVSKEILKQMATLASASLSHLICKRYRSMK